MPRVATIKTHIRKRNQKCPTVRDMVNLIYDILVKTDCAFTINPRIVAREYHGEDSVRLITTWDELTAHYSVNIHEWDLLPLDQRGIDDFVRNVFDHSIKCKKQELDVAHKIDRNDGRGSYIIFSNENITATITYRQDPYYQLLRNTEFVLGPVALGSIAYVLYALNGNVQFTEQLKYIGAAIASGALIVHSRLKGGNRQPKRWLETVIYSHPDKECINQAEEITEALKRI